MSNMSKVTEYRLQQTVVSRKLPMTQGGSDNVRLIRNYLIQGIKTKTGEDVKLSIPATIHMVLEEYAHIKGLK